MQERMMRWNDSWTIDESKRQDDLVAEQIHQARVSPWRSAAIIVVAMALAAVSEWVFEATVLAVAFIAAPVLVYGTSQITKALSKSSRSEAEE